MDEPTNLNPTPVPPPPPKPRGCGCLGGFLGGCLCSLALLFVMPLAMMVITLLFADKMTTNFTTTQERTRTSGDPAAENARGVLRLTLNGVITGSAPSAWYKPADCDAAVLEAIEDAIEDDDLHAIILELNSPGGAVGASDALHHALGRFKTAREGRVVVVQAGDLLASGAYYAAMQADWINVTPTTVVGSIGVIMPGVNAHGLAQKIGIADNSITSGAAKDLGNPLKPADPAHNAILQNVVDAMYDRFVGIVAEGRRLPESDVRKLADGRIFNAVDAVNLRLVDGIGYADDLPPKVAELLGCPEDVLVFYTPSVTGARFSAIFTEAPALIGRGAAKALLEESTPTLEYRFR